MNERSTTAEPGANGRVPGLPRRTGPATGASQAWRDLFNHPRRPEGFGPRLRRLLLDLDARIDTALFQARRWGRELYERFSVVMDRFHVSGWRRWYLVEP